MAKRVILIVLGALLALIGFAAAAGGAALMILFGTDNRLTSDTHRIGTQRVALVAAIDDVNDTHGFATVVGSPTLTITAATGSGKNVFIGVGPADAVDRYLAGVAIDRVTDFGLEPFRLTTQPRAGSATPARPASQPFWTASDSGSRASIAWKVSDGSYRLVIMNADAAPQVSVTSRARLTIPHLFAIGLAVLIGGLILLALGVVLIIAGARTRATPTPSKA